LLKFDFYYSGYIQTHCQKNKKIKRAGINVIVLTNKDKKKTKKHYKKKEQLSGSLALVADIAIQNCLTKPCLW
jgi:hypothetical protein